MDVAELDRRLRRDDKFWFATSEARRYPSMLCLKRTRPAHEQVQPPFQYRRAA
jgi:hypothetical protein